MKGTAEKWDETKILSGIWVAKCAFILFLPAGTPHGASYDGKGANTIFVQLENAFPADGSGGWEAAGGVWRGLEVSLPLPAQPGAIRSLPCWEHPPQSIRTGLTARKTTTNLNMAGWNDASHS